MHGSGRRDRVVPDAKDGPTDYEHGMVGAGRAKRGVKGDTLSQGVSVGVSKRSVRLAGWFAELRYVEAGVADGFADIRCGRE